jgi:hypothetical protein
MPDKEELKEVHYYAAQANAWINTRMERDKSLLTLSAGGIGLLVTLLTTRGVESIYALALYVLAILCFVVCLGFLIAILTLNSGYIEKVIQGTAERSKPLRAFDNIALSCFCMGVILSLVIGLSTGIESLQGKRGTVMSKDRLEQHDAAGDLKKSLNGMPAIAPKPPQPSPQQENQNTSGGQTADPDSGKK